MAQKKRKHGKVEARPARARMRFKPGVVVLIVLFSFCGCFVMYMVSALSQEDYWEREIADDFKNEAQDGSTGKRRKDVVNPVPSSERAEDGRMGAAAFLGDVASLAGYYETNANMVFTDALDGLSESRMHSIGRSLDTEKPIALYIWYQCPEDTEKGINTLRTLTDSLWEQAPSVPVYLLSATPTEDPEKIKQVDTWNAALFTLADSQGLYYVDTNTGLRTNEGVLAEAYKDPDTYYTTIGELILTHVAG